MKLDDLEEDVLGSARRAMRPSLSDAHRVRAAVLAKVGAATLGHAAGAKAAAAKVGGGAKAAGAKAASGWFSALGPIPKALLVGAATGGAGAAAILHLSGHDARESPAPSVATIHTVVAPPPRLSTPPAVDPVSPSENGSSSMPSPQRESHGSRQTTPPRGSGGTRDRLAEEVRLLRHAHQALRNGAPDVAERILRELAVSHPEGQLGEERAATKTQILCQREGGPAARSAAEKFLTAHPASLYAARIRSACMESEGENDGRPESRTRTPVRGER